MKSALALTLAAALAFAAVPALAQDAAACSAPAAPALPDGASASGDQMQAAAAAVRDFMAASDTYQDCEIKALNAQREAAKAAKTKLDDAVAKATSDRVSANQKDKEAVGAGWNTAVKAYKAAHPS